MPDHGLRYEDGARSGPAGRSHRRGLIHVSRVGAAPAFSVNPRSSRRVAPSSLKTVGDALRTSAVCFARHPQHRAVLTPAWTDHSSHRLHSRGFSRRCGLPLLPYHSAFLRHPHPQPKRPLLPIPTPSPRQGQGGTSSLHSVGSSPLRAWRVFAVVCAHSTDHVAHGAVSTTSPGCPLSCANAGRANIRTLIVPLAL